MKLIDTSMWVEFLHPSGDLRRREEVAALLRAGEACWCDMVRLELQRGSGEKNRRPLELIDATIPLLETTREVWNLACLLASKARAAGTPLPNTDILIFAVSHFHRVELLHCDRHYEALGKVAASFGRRP